MVDRVKWIEDGEGVLKDGLHGPPEGLRPCRSRVPDVGAVESDTSGCRLKQTKNNADFFDAMRR